MELTPELIRKHMDRLLETKVTVKSHQRTSKKGFISTVKQFERELSKSEQGLLQKISDEHKDSLPITHYTPDEKDVLASLQKKKMVSVMGGRAYIQDSGKKALAQYDADAVKKGRGFPKAKPETMKKAYLKQQEEAKVRSVELQKRLQSKINSSTGEQRKFWQDLAKKK